MKLDPEERIIAAALDQAVLNTSRAAISNSAAWRSRVGLPGAEPTVMDLPSMSRVTKLPLDTLKQLAKSTPVFPTSPAPCCSWTAV